MTNTKNNYFKQSSSFYRSVILLAFTAVVLFILLSVIYYQRISNSVLLARQEQIQKTAVNTVEGFNIFQKEALKPGLNPMVAERIFLNSVAQASQSYIWLVDPAGKLIYATDIPSVAFFAVEKADDYYILTEEQMTYFSPDKATAIPRSLYSSLNYGISLFRDYRTTWIFASCALDQSGNFLIIHQGVDISNQSFWLLTNSLLVPMIVSIVLAGLLFLFISKTIVKPLRMLSEAALRVSQGDLNTRIVVPELERDSILRYFMVDELTDMVVTVNHMIERIEFQDRERQVFISSIAHDLRTPLTSIKGFVTAIIDGTIPSERQDHYLKIIKQEVDRVANLVADMNNVSELGRKDSLHKTVFDINLLIYDTLNNLEAMLEAKNLGVEIDLYNHPKQQLFVLADREAIFRVVYNLIVNAIKFTPADGTISLSARPDKSKKLMLVTIEDSGSGIPMEQRGKIFESFYKADTSRSNPGSGLGLYICKQILTAHEQWIIVKESLYLGGASFTFSLDIAPAQIETQEKNKME